MDKKKLIITRKKQNETIPNPIHPIYNSKGNDNNIINIIDNDIDILQNKTGNEHLLKYPIHKLDYNQSILLIDTSYWVYYRFFALRNWYKKANPTKEFLEDYNWLEDQQFMVKYEKMFLEGIFTIATMWNVQMCNVVFCIDCNYKEIWRYQYHNDYKGTRLESHKKNGFNSFDIFNIVRDTYIPKLISKYKMSAIQVKQCEADDIIGYLAPYLSQHLNNSKMNNFIVENQDNTNIDKTYPHIIILASDNDYIQICDDKIILVDGNGKQLCNEKKSIGGEMYLIKKILSGDVSDNITSCYILNSYLIQIGIIKKTDEEYRKCTPSIIEKIISHPDTYKQLQNMLYELRKGNIISTNLFKDNQFINNSRLIDFKMLPNQLYQELKLISNHF